MTVEEALQKLAEFGLFAKKRYLAGDLTIVTGVDAGPITVEIGGVLISPSMHIIQIADDEWAVTQFIGEKELYPLDEAVPEAIARICDLLNKDVAREAGDPTAAHHIWCNAFGNPSEDCKQCHGMWRRYPYLPENAGALQETHFPDAETR